MIINADSIVPHLEEKVRPIQSDDSRHLLCPHCGVRTRLNTLGDGRRKCTVCGKKFRIHKVTAGNKLQQCAEILLCFCLDFSAHTTAQITQHRYRMVAAYYNHFRRLLAEKSLTQEKIQLFTAHTGDIHVLHDRSRCRWCKSTIRSDEMKRRLPVFGVQLQSSGEVTIDPLSDDEAAEALDRPESYVGFICCGKFHRLTQDERAKDNAEKLWIWIQERVRSRHGIWKRNPGFSLKELEWKFNNRSLHPDLQARKLIELMPMTFLTDWSL